MFSLISDAIDVVGVLLVFAAGVKFNEKWPGAGPYLTWMFTAVEDLISWVWGLFSKATNIGQPPSPTATK